MIKKFRRFKTDRPDGPGSGRPASDRPGHSLGAVRPGNPNPRRSCREKNSKPVALVFTLIIALTCWVGPALAGDGPGANLWPEEVLAVQVGAG